MFMLLANQAEKKRALNLRACSQTQEIRFARKIYATAEVFAFQRERDRE